MNEIRTIDFCKAILFIKVHPTLLLYSKLDIFNLGVFYKRTMALSKNVSNIKNYNFQNFFKYYYNNRAHEYYWILVSFYLCLYYNLLYYLYSILCIYFFLYLIISIRFIHFFIIQFLSYSNTNIILLFFFLIYFIFEKF